MNTEQATKTVVTAVNLAQSRGAFNLKEAKILAEAVDVLFPEQTAPEAQNEPNAASTEDVVEETQG